MNDGRALQVSNVILSGMAGLASFVFSLAVFIHIKELDGQILASIVAGLFCLMICYAASERPDASSAKAMASLAQRLLAVEDGDLTSPPPDALRRSNPKLAAAVDTLFEEVRASIENAHALGMYDPVTSLPNRLHFRSEADKLLGAPNVVQVPTVVDLERYPPPNPAAPDSAGVRVCWIGQQSTAAFLAPLAPMFRELAADQRMRFTAIGIDTAAANLPMDSLAWSEASEAADIAACDIGIMPLPDTPFERGKCGYKLIQYMACGLPVVASPVGANRDIVQHGVDGFLADSEAEWRVALTRLAANSELRRRRWKWWSRVRARRRFARRRFRGRACRR